MNLLGVWVLYMYDVKGNDILICIYGMIELNLIGCVVLNGCIWMCNEVVMDLYE